MQFAEISDGENAAACLMEFTHLHPARNFEMS